MYSKNRTQKTKNVTNTTRNTPPPPLLPPKIKQNRKQITNKQKQNERQGGEWECLRKMV